MSELEYMKGCMEYLKRLAIQANDEKQFCLDRNSTAFDRVWRSANDLTRKWTGFNSFISSHMDSLRKSALRLEKEYKATKSTVKFDNMVHEIEENYGALFKTLIEAMKPKPGGTTNDDLKVMEHASFLYHHPNF
ncbi:MAG: hypothetical protein J1F66_03040 [Clostridiales bacterium]|nr:hypothetical protein [Clostridiales bacterium]